MGLMRALIGQCKYPSGPLGRMFLHAMNMAHGDLVDRSLAGIALPAGATLLDVGCGGGRAIRTLRKRFEPSVVYGVDPSDTAIRAAAKQNRAAARAGQAIFQKAVVEALPFEDRSFDLVTAFQTHYFWPDLRCGFAEIARVLGPGGQFLLAAETYKIHYHMSEYKAPSELESLARAVGFASASALVAGKHLRLLCVRE